LSSRASTWPCTAFLIGPSCRGGHSLGEKLGGPHALDGVVAVLAMGGADSVIAARYRTPTSRNSHSLARRRVHACRSTMPCVQGFSLQA
jgi:hypothetical protein